MKYRRRLSSHSRDCVFQIDSRVKYLDQGRGFFVNHPRFHFYFADEIAVEVGD